MANAVNDYEVTFTNGEVVVIAAPTPERAQTIAEAHAARYGCQGLSVVSIESLDSISLGLA